MFLHIKEKFGWKRFLDLHAYLHTRANNGHLGMLLEISFGISFLIHMVRNSLTY